MMKTIKINLYEFNELSQEAKDVAIWEHINFEIHVMDEDSPYYDLAIEMEKMQTPWFLGEVIYEKEKDSIIDTILINEYYFYQDGTFAE